MKRLALLAVAALALGAAPAEAATKEYSTGNVQIRIGAKLDETLNVPDAGPVSFLRVSFRISVPDTSALAVSLVSPRGSLVPLVTHRGSGPEFGTDSGCGGLLTFVDSDMTSKPIAKGSSPFTESPYRAEGNLKSLNGEDARGRWKLRVENDGAPATLQCLTLDISRAIPETIAARRGAVRASLGYEEKASFYEHMRLKVVRAGRTVLDAPVGHLSCPDCNSFRPVSLKVVDLDGGDPEVLLETYTQGAHCCTAVLVLRYDPATRTYKPKLLGFGNYGYKLVDLDHDGLPEIEAFDERFVYRYGAYVFSSAPPLISEYRQGQLVDVTRRFPALVRRSAVTVGKEFLTKKRPSNDVDLRTYVAVYVADQYLLGRPAEAKRALDYALKQGLLYRGRQHLGSPAGSAFAAVLLRDLAKWGYLHSR